MSSATMRSNPIHSWIISGFLQKIWSFFFEVAVQWANLVKKKDVSVMAMNLFYLYVLLWRCKRDILFKDFPRFWRYFLSGDDWLIISFQEQFAAMRDLYMKHGDGFVIVYSVTDAKSLAGTTNIFQNLIRIRQRYHVCDEAFARQPFNTGIRKSSFSL